MLGEKLRFWFLTQKKLGKQSIKEEHVKLLKAPEELPNILHPYGPISTHIILFPALSLLSLVKISCTFKHQLPLTTIVWPYVFQHQRKSQPLLFCLLTSCLQLDCECVALCRSTFTVFNYLTLAFKQVSHQLHSAVHSVKDWQSWNQMKDFTAVKLTFIYVEVLIRSVFTHSAGISCSCHCYNSLSDGLSHWLRGCLYDNNIAEW